MLVSDTFSTSWPSVGVTVFDVFEMLEACGGKFPL